MFVNFFYPSGKLMVSCEVVTQFSEIKNNIINFFGTKIASENSMFVTFGKEGEITDRKIGFEGNLFATLKQLELIERGAVA